SFSNVRDLTVFNGALYPSFGDFGGGSVFRLEAGSSTWGQVGGLVPSFSKMAEFEGELNLAGTNSQFELPVTDHVYRLVDDEWVPLPSASDYDFTFIDAMASADDGSGEALFIGGTIGDIGGTENLNGIAK